MKYFDSKDLGNFIALRKLRPASMENFFLPFYKVTDKNSLLRKKMTLKALPIAYSPKCPYGMDAYTTKPYK